jgi:hypothetical protein
MNDRHGKKPTRAAAKDGLRIRQLAELDLVSSEDLVNELLKREFLLIIGPPHRTLDDDRDHLEYRYNSNLVLSLVAAAAIMIAHDLVLKCKPTADEDDESSR